MKCLWVNMLIRADTTTGDLVAVEELVGGGIEETNATVEAAAVAEGSEEEYVEGVEIDATVE